MNVKHRAPFWDFDVRLFCEGFRQLRTVGIFALVIMCLAAALLPIGLAISSYSVVEYELYGTTSYEPVFTRDLVTIPQMHPLSLAPMYTIALLMPLILFSFLNKRRTSDFYHALPTSRAGVFVSFFAAVMAWILLDLIASTAVSVVTLSCFPKLFKIVWSSLLPTLCTSLAGSLMTAGCMTFAMCITGTLFTNLLIAALLFFGPRILMWYIGNCISECVRILPDMGNIPILDVSYNVPLSIINDVLYSGDGAALDNWTGIIYSAVIGFLYFIGALAVFRIRRSEAAEQPAATPLLQTVYRLTLTFFVTLIPVWAIFNIVAKEKMHVSYLDVFGIFVLYIVAALTFCIYELITTKKAKLLLKAAPTFIIVLVANLLLIGGMLLGSKSILAFRPTAEEIRSVSLANTESDTGNAAYFEHLVSKEKITDPDILKLVSKHLADAAELNTPTAGYASDTWEVYTVTVRTKHSEKLRQLSFTEEELSRITDYLQSHPGYQTAYQLPTPTKAMQISLWNIEDKQAEEIYAIMVREFSKLPFATRYELSSQYHFGNVKQALTDSLNVQISRDGKIYYLRFPLIAEYYPEAYAKYLQYVYENETADRAKILHYLPLALDQNYELTIEILPHDGDSPYRTFVADVDTLTAYGKLLIKDEWVPRIQDAPLPTNDWLVRITVNAPKFEATKEDTYMQSYSAYFPFPRDFTMSEAFYAFEAEIDKANDWEAKKYE